MRTSTSQSRKIMDYMAVMALSLVLGIFFSPIGLDGKRIFTLQPADFLNYAKAILSGQVLYRDLLDHKGVWQYIPALTSQMMSRTSPIPYLWMGISSMTVLFLTVYWFLSRNSRLREPVLVQTIVAELGFVAITLNFMDYLLVDVLFMEAYLFAADYVRHNDRCQSPHFFVIGIALGIILDVKYPYVLPFLPLFVCHVVPAVKKHGIGHAAKPVLCGTTGILLSIAPQVAYNTWFGVWKEYFDVMGKTGVVWWTVTLAGGLGVLLTIAGGFASAKKEVPVAYLFMVGVLFIVPTFGFAPYIYAPLVLIWILMESTEGICQKRKTVFVTVMCLGFSSFVTWADFYHHSLPGTYEVQEKYGITNENILYLCEDVGYGIYSEASYRVPVSFLMSRAATPENGTYLEEVYIPLIQSGTYEYVLYTNLLNRATGIDFQAIVEEKYEQIERVPLGILYRKKVF